MQNPKIIIITGASSGIGAALALHYAAPGVTLGLSGRDAARLESVALACHSRGAFVEPRVVDVTNADGMDAWIQGFHDRHGGLDLVVANAGVSGGTGGNPTMSEDTEQVRTLFAVNVDGVINTVHPALALMEHNRRGQIAIMASLAGFNPWPGAPAYGATKAAVRMYGEALAAAVRPKGVVVSVVCPGFVQSRMTAVNDFPMPLMMDADRAAIIIARELARGRVRIVFPLPIYWLVRFLGALPPAFVGRFLAHLPQKPASKHK